MVWALLLACSTGPTEAEVEALRKEVEQLKASQAAEEEAQRIAEEEAAATEALTRGQEDLRRQLQKLEYPASIWMGKGSVDYQVLCVVCHGGAGEGTSIGPSLYGLGGKSGDELTAYLKTDHQGGAYAGSIDGKMIEYLEAAFRTDPFSR